MNSDTRHVKLRGRRGCIWLWIVPVGAVCTTVFCLPLINRTVSLYLDELKKAFFLHQFLIIMLLVAAILTSVPRVVSLWLRFDEKPSRIFLRARSHSTNVICKEKSNSSALFNLQASWSHWSHWLVIFILAVILLLWPIEKEVLGSIILLTLFASLLSRDSATSIFVTKQNGELPTDRQLQELQRANIAFRPWVVDFGNIEPGNNTYRFLVVKNPSSRDKHVEIQSEAPWLGCGYSNRLSLEGNCTSFSTIHILLRAKCNSSLQTHQNDALIHVLVDDSRYTIHAKMFKKSPTKTEQVSSLLIACVLGAVISVLLNAPFAVLGIFQTGRQVLPIYLVSFLIVMSIYCLFLLYGIRVQETINYTLAMIKAIISKGVIGALLGIFLGVLLGLIHVNIGITNVSILKLCFAGMGIGALGGATSSLWRLQNVAWHPEVKKVK